MEFTSAHKRNRFCQLGMIMATSPRGQSLITEEDASLIGYEACTENCKPMRGKLIAIDTHLDFGTILVVNLVLGEYHG